MIESLRGRVDGRPSLREVAAEHGVSLTYVRMRGKDAGIEVAADARTQTKSATEAKRLTNAQRRAKLAERFLIEAEKALDAIEAGSTMAGFSFGVFVEGQTKKITARDRRELLTTAAIASDKHRMLDQYDSDADTTDVAKFLVALGGAVSAVDKAREASLASPS